MPGGFIGMIFELAVLASMVAAVICNAYVIGTCDLLTFQTVDGQFGPWRADVGNGCVGWNKDTTDAGTLINMARACSMIAFIFGIILTVFGFFNQCLCPLPCTQRIMDISGLGVQITLCLIWPVWRSDVCTKFGCYWGSGASALVCCQCFYLLASIFSRCMREPRYKRRRDDDEPRREERREEPDKEEPEKEDHTRQEE